jgi:glycosyltransferase involved in cell wall biosynthesis
MVPGERLAVTKRVLIDARYLDGSWSGIGTYSRLLIEHLAKVDTETEYLVVVRKGFHDNLAVGPNFEVLSWAPRPVSWQTVLRFHDYLEALQPDLVHVLSPIAPMFWNGPLMITLHDLQPFIDPDFHGRRMRTLRAAYNLFYSMAYPTSMNASRWIMCDSFATRDDAQRFMPEVNDKLVVVYPGLDLPEDDPIGFEHVEAIRAKLEIRGRYCLYYGSTRPNKNLPMLVQAFQAAILSEQNALSDMQLILVLKRDRFFRDVERVISRNRLEDRVKVIDPMPPREKRALLHGAAAFLFPTRYEGFGFPPLEAMAEGVPVLGSTSGALPEILGDAAVLADPFDRADIAEGIVRVTTNRELRRTLIERGRARAARFDWTSTAELVRDTYRLLF